MSQHELVISPKITVLLEQCAILQEEVASLLAEREDLVKTVGPNVFAQYASIIGVKEHEVLSLDVEVRRLKSTIQKIQAIENHDKKPNLEQIEAVVEDELREWQEKVEKMVSKIQECQTRLENLMDSESAGELQALYRMLVKALHPDVNPKLHDPHKLLWDRVQKAYSAANLHELRALVLFLDDIPEGLESISQLDELLKRRDTLKQQIQKLIQQISEIEGRPPLSLRKRLDDGEWIESKIAESDQRVEALQVEKSDLEDWLAGWKARS